MKFYHTQIEAESAAKDIIQETKETLNIINVYGEGYAVVTADWKLNRNYYHGDYGKKMFFDFVCSVS